MIVRRAYVCLLVATAVLSCGPSKSDQTVSFVLSLNSKRLEQIEFTARQSSGSFVGETGKCVPGSSVAPDSALAATAVRVVVAAPRAAAAVPAPGVPPAPDDIVNPAVSTEAVSTTSTSSTTFTTLTTNTTTSTTSTTTTTLELQPCTLTFRLQDSVTLKSLEWDTDYSSVSAELEGEGENVECTSLVSQSLAVFNDQEASNVLTSGLISLAGFTGPVDLARCNLRAPAQPHPNDFVITVTEASNDGPPLVPAPAIVVDAIECEGISTTSTTMTTLADDTTTTTLTVGVCGDDTINEGEDCDDGNRTSGDGCNSACRWEDFFSSLAEPGELTVHLTHVDGIRPGSTLAFCKFDGDLEGVDFEVTVFSCSLAGEGNCNPASDATVSVSTTTTTTTTTTTSTTTTSTTTTTTTTLF